MDADVGQVELIVQPHPHLLQSFQSIHHIQGINSALIVKYQLWRESCYNFANLSD